MSHRVIVYSLPECGFCQETKKYFHHKRVAFEDIDVSQDEQKVLEMVQKSGQETVPVVEIDGNIVVGYQPAAFDSLLN